MHHLKHPQANTITYSNVPCAFRLMDETYNSCNTHTVVIHSTSLRFAIEITYFSSTAREIKVQKKMNSKE